MEMNIFVHVTILYDVTAHTTGTKPRVSKRKANHWRQLVHQYTACACRHCRVTSCHISHVFAQFVSKVRGRLENIDKYFNLLLRNDPTIKTDFTVIIIICHINLHKKIM